MIEARNRAAVLPSQPGRVCRATWARQIGAHVPRRECFGSVLHSYNRACTITTSDGALVVLLSPSAGMVAHGIRLMEPLAFQDAARPGDAVWLTSDRIKIGDGLAVGLRSAEPWQPAFQPGAPLSPFAAEAVAALHRLSDGGELLDLVLGRAEQSALCSIVGTALPAIAVAVRRDDAAATLATLSALVGLGPGLTPSGDDFIVGLLAGLGIGAAAPSVRALLCAMCAGVAELAARTTPVSRQHLYDASQLAFSERLSDVCLAIVRGLPAAVLLARAAAQLAVGASSGGDAMAGLVFALSHCGVLSHAGKMQGS